MVQRLSRKGYKKILLLGGSHINTLFLRANLVDELHLTVEPKIFGKGTLLIQEKPFNISLKLITIKKLNVQGTLLLQYKVEKCL